MITEVGVVAGADGGFGGISKYEQIDKSWNSQGEMRVGMAEHSDEVKRR